MDKKVKKSLVVAVIGVFAVISAFVWQKVQVFVNKGLADSQKIIIADNNNCSEQNETYFGGCSSIL